MKNFILALLLFINIIFATLFNVTAQTKTPILWKHLSTSTGDLEPPNKGKQQTATAVFDVDKDGDNDFLISERSKSPSLVWYQRNVDSWLKYVVDETHLRIEAGSAFHDIDSDGDLDVVFGGDSSSNQVWWWENPYPEYEPANPWIRHIIKDSGKMKHHDQLFGDFDGDGRIELVFWNQGAQTLYLAKIPDSPRTADKWHCKAIYTWSSDSEMKQRGTYPSWKRTNEHEGLYAADIDLDGIMDIVGGGQWFKHIENGMYLPNIIDASYSFSRSAAGQLIQGGRPEIILVVGDGLAPMMLYEWQEGTWVSRILLDEVDNGHTLDVIDFDGDGNLDVFCAEMNIGNNHDAKTWLLYGDGKGNFKTTIALEGYGLHESKITDLDGDGDYDILGKPYRWDAPRVDIWLNEGNE